MHERKINVLILCTGNSCRSQLAEAIWRHEAGDRYDVQSAGVAPKGIHPLTLTVLEEAGISTTGLWSKHVDQIETANVDLLVTVCDNARETCPVFPKRCRRLHWPFADPATAAGSAEDVLAFFRRVRDEIHSRIRQFLAAS